MVLPPSKAGAVNATDTDALLGVAVPIVGASGTVTGIALAETLGLPCPTSLTADTLKLYDTAFVSPMTVALVNGEVPSANSDQVELAESLNSMT
jgi:hypothetical protein